MSSPCPQTPSRPAWWRQRFARRPGTPCTLEMAFAVAWLGRQLQVLLLGISLPSHAALGSSAELRALGESSGS